MTARRIDRHHLYDMRPLWTPTDRREVDAILASLEERFGPLTFEEVESQTYIKVTCADTPGNLAHILQTCMDWKQADGSVGWIELSAYNAGPREHDGSERTEPVGTLCPRCFTIHNGDC